MYAHGEMSSAELIETSRQHVLPLTCEDPTLCPFSKVSEAEVRLNGLLVATLSECDNSDVYDSSPSVGYYEVWFQFSPTTHGVRGLWKNFYAYLYADFGPVSDPDLIFDIDTVQEGDIREVRFKKFEIDLDSEEYSSSSSNED